MKNKTLVLFATYQITPGIIAEFVKMQNCGVECVLGINNTKKVVDSECGVSIRQFYGIECQCILLDEEMLHELGLYVVNHNVGYTLWHCTDYWAYVARKFFPNFDFYWEIDYDCFFNASNYQSFFDFYKQDFSDFIVSRLRKESQASKWCWIKNTQWAYESDEYWHGSLFALARYSAGLLDYLYHKRLLYKERFLKAKTPKSWLMCEFFTATEAAMGGFSMRNFTDDGHQIRIAPFDFNKERVYNNPDYKMYHCVKCNLIESKVESTKNSIMRQVKNIPQAKAVDRIHAHLAYKLGNALIVNDSLWGYVRMPFVLSFIKESHKKQQQKYQEKIIKNPNAKLPKLESYPDYKQALKEKQTFTYQLGLKLMEADCVSGGGGGDLPAIS